MALSAVLLLSSSAMLSTTRTLFGAAAAHAAAARRHKRPLIHASAANPLDAAAASPLLPLVRELTPLLHFNVRLLLSSGMHVRSAFVRIFGGKYSLFPFGSLNIVLHLVSIYTVAGERH